MNDEDNERDNLYARAESISAELGIMTLELKSCIDNVNSRAGGQGEASDPLSKVVHILNNQLQALSNVDDSSEQVTRRLEQLTGMYIVSVTACLPVEHTKLHTCKGIFSVMQMPVLLAAMTLCQLCRTVCTRSSKLPAN